MINRFLKNPGLRSRWMALQNLLGVRRGFFLPYRYANQMVHPSVGAYPELRVWFEQAKPQLIAQLKLAEQYFSIVQGLGQRPPPAPRFEQSWFPRLDAAMAYALVRDHQPQRIIEVGSGHSTRFMAQAVRDGEFSCAITCIDPAPRAQLLSLPVQWINQTVQNIDVEVFDALAPEDILFIDSSHLLVPGSDVDFLLNRIWPRLKSGVLVHIHDVFLPDGYPSSWNWRGYNEQNALAGLMLHGADLVFASQFVTRYLRSDWEKSPLARLPIMDESLETSLWLRKRGGHG